MTVFHVLQGTLESPTLNSYALRAGYHCHLWCIMQNKTNIPAIEK